MLEPPFTEDLTPPYSVNMSLFLPDVTYLHPGLPRTVRQIKTEPSHSLMHPTCQASRIPATIQEHPGLFRATDAAGGGFYIKQEVTDFQDVPLFQLLNSDLEQLTHGPQVNPIPIAPLSLPVIHGGPVESTKPPNGLNECLSVNKHLVQQLRSTYLPPSPPDSEPPSPDRCREFVHALSPPPSYEASIASKVTCQSHNSIGLGQTSRAAPVQNQDQNYTPGFAPSPSAGPVQCSSEPPGVGSLSPVMAQSAPARYNRRNNPDLERRRIHHCDVPGEAIYLSDRH